MNILCSASHHAIAGVGARKFHIPPEGKLQWCKECAPKVTDNHPTASFCLGAARQCAAALVANKRLLPALPAEVLMAFSCAVLQHPGAVFHRNRPCEVSTAVHFAEGTFSVPSTSPSTNLVLVCLCVYTGLRDQAPIARLPLGRTCPLVRRLCQEVPPRGRHHHQRQPALVSTRRPI